MITAHTSFIRINLSLKWTLHRATSMCLVLRVSAGLLYRNANFLTNIINVMVSLFVRYDFTPNNIPILENIGLL